MKDARRVDLVCIREHEAAQPRLNVSLGGYHMPAAEEFVNWHVILEEAELDRLFLLSDFVPYTVERLGRLKGVEPTGKFNNLVQEKLNQNIDLRLAQHLAPVIVCADIETRPLTVIDGNHQLTAHYLRFGTISGIHAYICAHPLVSQWGHVAPGARG